MNVQTSVKASRETNEVTETTEMAKETTLLSPRFYTTDFDELDRVDVTPIRESWDEIMAVSYTHLTLPTIYSV